MNYLDAHPDEASIIAEWREKPKPFVPFVADGKFGGGVRLAGRSAKSFWIFRRLSVADYVVGIELLGYRFAVAPPVDGKFSLMVMMPGVPEPEAYDAMFCALREAFGPGRTQEVVDFLSCRDGAQ